MANATPFYTRSPKTIVVYPINGQTEFTIPFEFLARKFVVVTLLGVDRLPLVLNTDYRFVSVNRIQLLSPVPAGYPNIELRRLTSATDRLVDFHDGSILRAYDLNLAQIQTMHVAEEARDLTADNIGVNDNGDLDARNRKIVNLANGTENNDAVNLGQLRQFDTSTANNADRAEAAKNRAVQAETNTARDSASAAVNATKAVASAGTAVQAASDANRSYDKIVPLEQSTVANAQVATQQAQRSQSEADRAKSEADKLANINQFAQTIERVDGTAPVFKSNLAIGGNSASTHAYISINSKASDESGVTRKGFIGVAGENEKHITVGSDVSAVRLQTPSGSVQVGGNLVHSAANRLLVSAQDDNDCYIDIAARNSENKFRRIYSGGGRLAVTENVSTTGEWLRDIISTYQYPSDPRRGIFEVGNANMRSKAWGSTWADSLTTWNSGNFVDANYAAGSAISAVTLSVPSRPSVGWPTNIGFGTLMDGRAGLMNPYIWAAGMDNAELRGWEFQSDGRIRSFNQLGSLGIVSFMGDWAPRNAPIGAAGYSGGLQIRYGVVYAAQAEAWNWHAYSEPFPTATLSVALTQRNPPRFDNTWNPKIGSVNNTGFNFAGGGQERDFYYIAVGY
ncbi:Tail fibre protein [Escherichia phage vB_Eco_Bam]|uniref:Tail fibre protein n=1 Tax=Escherichia phage vB_Eco_Bam TaxID=2898833 RepID=A0A9P0VFN1_9CAUD|nr:Mak_038 [Escherichia phage vB_Eco_Mak]CAH7774612.1 tail fiber protein [Aeromonas phage T7-Ah] [Escherichia phage vB_Eco_Titus]CAI9888963.1 Tail fibre protein [Escherichia phage vB_Eco_Bam]